tara:strand:+ start:2344 stop:2868 length:525 start_codon:yes stop_codon:yes gene_type:complete
MPEMYLFGGKGITNPVDVFGNPIHEGDILTHSWFEDDYVKFYNVQFDIWDSDKIEASVHEATYVVQYNVEKEYYYATGIKKELYMHDFRFEYCKNLTYLKKHPIHVSDDDTSPLIPILLVDVVMLSIAVCGILYYVKTLDGSFGKYDFPILVTIVGLYRFLDALLTRHYLKNTK